MGNWSAPCRPLFIAITSCADSQSPSLFERSVKEMSLKVSFNLNLEVKSDNDLCRTAPAATQGLKIIILLETAFYRILERYLHTLSHVDKTSEAVILYILKIAFTASL